MSSPSPSEPVAPVVVAVIFRESCGDAQVLVGRYHPEHRLEYLRGLHTTPGGKRDRVGGGPGLWIWEDPLEAALREVGEETGCREGLRPILAESFEARVFGHGYDDGVMCTAVLLAAGPEYAPRTVDAEAAKVGEWRWWDVARIRATHRLSPLALMCLVRFGLGPR